MYKIVFTAKSRKELRRFNKEEAKKILDKINLLSYPFKSNLNIAKLTGSNRSYRLKFGKIRVIFEVDFKAELISITKIGYRKNVYKFLLT
ncbi:type II toxin-antitoxin system RelE/ParE family toxin [Candidatus Roizmanbacteria bacterium]|nr:type II toxin-antitoxin system RelE/ParE family toxin [Candidatus Roizmanbacteria bacterium]